MPAPCLLYFVQEGVLLTPPSPMYRHFTVSSVTCPTCRHIPAFPHTHPPNRIFARQGQQSRLPAASTVAKQCTAHCYPPHTQPVYLSRAEGGVEGVERHNDVPSTRALVYSTGRPLPCPAAHGSLCIRAGSVISGFPCPYCRCPGAFARVKYGSYLASACWCDCHCFRPTHCPHD